MESFSHGVTCCVARGDARVVLDGADGVLADFPRDREVDALRSAVALLDASRSADPANLPVL